MKTQKEIKFIDGFSESVWKSLVVKSLRIGWVDGLIAASYRLNKSTIQSLLTAGIFEDLFPASFEQLNEQLKQIKEGDYIALCSHQTHHGRGFTEEFCNMEKEAVRYGRMAGYKIMEEIIRPNSNLTWLPPRIFNCLYTWNKINPQDTEKLKRNPLEMDFIGIPDCIIDGHTYEGKQQGKNCLLLSGHYENHRAIGKIVMEQGWKPIVDKFKTDKINLIKKEQLLF